MAARHARQGSGAQATGATPELWTRLAWLPLLAVGACAIYLGSRPGGPGPVLVFQWAPFAIAGTALIALAAASIASAFRRPFLRRPRVVAFAALSSAILFASMPFAYPTSHVRRPSSVRFAIPLEGEWTVRCGGEGWRENALAFQPSRCRGFDFVKVSGHERGDAGFGEPVSAPTAGRVVRVHDGEPDLAAGASWRGGERLGNHLVLEVAPSQFLFLAHLRSGSILVSEGELVPAGAPLARVGSSGAPLIASGPHLSIHLQDSLRGPAEGIPFAFTGYEVEGRAVERGVPRGGVGLDGLPIGDRIRSTTSWTEQLGEKGPD